MNKRQRKKLQGKIPAPASAGNAPHSTMKPPPEDSLVYVPPPVRQCDDELTVLASKLRPKHRMFADLILQGRTGCEAVQAAGFRASDVRSAATRILRREDVRRYIRLSQKEVAIATRVTRDALVTHLWEISRDPKTNQKVKGAALTHLVRIFTATGNHTEKPAPGAQAGLTPDLINTLESQFLGIRQPGPEA